MSHSFTCDRCGVDGTAGLHGIRPDGWGLMERKSVICVDLCQSCFLFTVDVIEHTTMPNGPGESLPLMGVDAIAKEALETPQLSTLESERTTEAL